MLRLLKEKKSPKAKTIPIPDDYLERVYAGVLGKLIGVYMGRPFEGWTHQRIIAELGHIRYFVNEKLGLPVVVTDDDVSGTFTFVRALEEHSRGKDGISAEDVGRTWLNNVIQGRTIFWWGGNGVSTEHTAYLNLKRGLRAPQSGSISTNGTTIAQQIGAQIFIDGFAMTCPGNPDLAAKLASAAASVSHDGIAVHAARLWAAMEAEAFISADVQHLLDVGLEYIPQDSLIRTLVNDVRGWCAEDGDWLKTRERIEEKYGYDKFPGICHVVPNHGIMVMALIYGGGDFGEAMHVVNTCGWDTDCNSGNLGCLVAIMHGLKGFELVGEGDDSDGGDEKEGRRDWRGPLGDRALISSADGGYSINNAARIAYDVANMGLTLAGKPPLPPPKDGAQLHFTLPGSTQGFRVHYLRSNIDSQDLPKATIAQTIDTTNNTPSLKIQVFRYRYSQDVVEVITDTFAPPEVRQMPIYELVGSPLIYPGQTIRAHVRADDANAEATSVGLVLRGYKYSDAIDTVVNTNCSISPGESTVLEWTIPDKHFGGRPIQAVGLRIWVTKKCGLSTIWLDYLCWDGPPNLTLRPATAVAAVIGEKEYSPATFYQQSFVNGADTFDATGEKFIIAQDSGEGIVSYGTREWTDYKIVYRGFIINKGSLVGVAARVRGLNRWYGVLLSDGGKRISIVKAHDEERVELASKDFAWKVDTPYTLTVEVEGDELRARVEGEASVELSAHDAGYGSGGIGIVATDGSAFVDSIDIRPLKDS
ncbi:ADP-ribosylglycohydrolase [Hypoxylon trugodes]|uniref:ADP-ribosylglycohydrolase n=1 Tax=Hypoxylon trugodes TaxID=326681 RepID=UPI00218F93E6|nr:ADP-ribosylglycohydrolase [Hypoxylon trugodes]KAI1385960.1 ADP-ribosylglycohydrolase [Hypoxylon trugodes]